MSLANRLGLGGQMKINVWRATVGLIFALWCLSAAHAGPSVGGGYGSVIRSPHSRQLVLWDLYLAQPDFTEHQPGDQIQVSSAGHERVARWVGYREFQSYQWLTKRMTAWK